MNKEIVYCTVAEEDRTRDIRKLVQAGRVRKKYSVLQCHYYEI